CERVWINVYQRGCGLESYCPDRGIRNCTIEIYLFQAVVTGARFSFFSIGKVVLLQGAAVTACHKTKFAEIETVGTYLYFKAFAVGFAGRCPGEQGIVSFGCSFKRDQFYRQRSVQISGSPVRESGNTVQRYQVISRVGYRGRISSPGAALVSGTVKHQVGFVISCNFVI